MSEIAAFSPSNPDSPHGKESHITPELGAIVEVDGKKYQWLSVPTGKTVYDPESKQMLPGSHSYRTYFSHSTTEAGPGPGWDSRFSLLDDDLALASYGRTFTEEQVYDPLENMPDELFLTLAPLEYNE